MGVRPSVIGPVRVGLGGAVRVVHRADGAEDAAEDIGDEIGEELLLLERVCLRRPEQPGPA